MERPDRISLGNGTEAPADGRVTDGAGAVGKVPSRGDATVTFEGEWDPSTLGTAMASAGLTLAKSDGTRSRWVKDAPKGEAFPLHVDVAVSETRKAIRLRGFVLDDDGRTHLTIDGDDGAPHHAKSGALGDFDTVCDALRHGLRGAEGGDGQAAGMPKDDPGMSVPQPVPTQPTHAQPMAQPMTTQPYPQQPVGSMPAMPSQQLQAGYGYPQQTMMQQPMAGQIQPQPQQFGYGSPEATPQAGQQPGIAPGWAVQSVPNKCWMYIAISCVELILLIAESIYINILISLVPILLFSWPAVPAIVYSICYKNEFQAGRAQMALIQMRRAWGWILGAGIWCLIRVLINLTMCSQMY